MIAASIPIIVPALRWIGEKLSVFRYMIAAWTARSKKTSESRDNPPEAGWSNIYDEPAKLSDG